jgi:ABC-type lipoprotein export system ATPase subunit
MISIKEVSSLLHMQYALYPHLTVKQNILFPLQNLRGADRMSKNEMLDKAYEAARLVQIDTLMDRKPSELSGGQQQRVAIARALISNPKLILADEPTGNLDSRNGQEVMNLLKELNAEGTTVIMVTHSQHDASYADRTLCLFDGQLVTDLKNRM